MDVQHCFLFLSLCVYIIFQVCVSKLSISRWPHTELATHTCTHKIFKFQVELFSLTPYTCLRGQKFPAPCVSGLSSTIPAVCWMLLNVFLSFPYMEMPSLVRTFTVTLFNIFVPFFMIAYCKYEDYVFWCLCIFTWVWPFGQFVGRWAGLLNEQTWTSSAGRCSVFAYVSLEMEVFKRKLAQQTLVPYYVSHLKA